MVPLMLQNLADSMVRRVQLVFRAKLAAKGGILKLDEKVGLKVKGGVPTLTRHDY